MIKSSLTDRGVLARFAFFLLNGGNLFLLNLAIKIEQPSLLGWCFVMLVIIIFVMISLNALIITRKISIDLDKITYTNWLTGKVKSYDFKDLDGYVTIIKPGRVLGSMNDVDFESVLLIKENKRIGEIFSCYYSNYDELKDGLKDLKYLGREDNNMLNTFKELFM